MTRKLGAHFFSLHSLSECSFPGGFTLTQALCYAYANEASNIAPMWERQESQLASVIHTARQMWLSPHVKVQHSHLYTEDGRRGSDCTLSPAEINEGNRKKKSALKIRSMHLCRMISQTVLQIRTWKLGNRGMLREKSQHLRELQIKDRETFICSTSSSQIPVHFAGFCSVIALPAVKCRRSAWLSGCGWLWMQL